jgi:crotonobetainyl-CoA:carnitine CoA-transferase CaiB-like acyl-CoA transferase
MLPLDGITVVGLEQAVAAPFATRQLADLGARVIKVERPEGDFARGYDRTVHGQSSYFVWLNRGKESVTLDLKDERDLALMRSMLARADVFVQNLAPGAADRLGLDDERLRAANPRLITCSISGYGSGSTYDAKKAYDLLIQCEAGLVSLTGTPEEPVKVGVSIADICAGSYAYSGILTALLVRARTGTGSAVHVSMLDALAEWVSQPYLYAHYGDQPVRRSGSRHPSIAPYGPFDTADGSIFLAIQNEREWVRLCADVLGAPELAVDVRFATNPDRVAHEPELRAIVNAKLARQTSTATLELLDEYGIANARLRQIGELGEHPALAERRRWAQIGTPAGPVKALLPPVDISGMQPAMGDVPGLGDATDRIRAEFGRLTIN